MEAQNITLTSSGHVKYVRPSHARARLDNFTPPPAQDPDTFSVLDNVIVGVNNNISRKWGTTLFANPTIDARRIFEAHFVNGRNRFILTASDGTGVLSNSNKIVAVNENGTLVTTTHSVFTPSAGASHPNAIFSNNYAYFLDGIGNDLLKWDSDDDPTASTTITIERQEGDFSWTFPSKSKWGIDPPTTTIVPSNEGDGNVEVSGLGRAYTYIYRNSLTGHCSDIAPFSDRFGVNSDGSTVGDIAIGLTNIQASADPQVSEIVVLATAQNGGQDTLYAVITLSNGEVPDLTTMFIDENREGDLVNKEVFNELDGNGNSIGCIDNSTPQTIFSDAAIAQVHHGRIFVLDGHILYWSKSLYDVTTSTTVAGAWQESFPAENQIPLSSAGTEVGTALLSDEVNLYVGTNRSVYFLSGDPTTTPLRALFHEVGVMNNQVWKLVFHNGQQVGAIWLTPDKRVIRSDFNTYQDIGRPIQTSLNVMDDGVEAPGIRDTACAVFVADQQYEFFFLSSGLDTNLYVYNVVTDAWVRWITSQGNDVPAAMAYMWDTVNNRALPVFAPFGFHQQLVRWNKLTTVDRSTEGGTAAIPSVKTNWLSFEDPAMSKLINDIEIQTEDPDLKVSLEAAMSFADFDSPVVVSTGEPLVTSPFGTYKVYIYTLPTRHRFYRIGLTDIDDSSETELLSYMSVDYSPLHHS